MGTWILDALTTSFRLGVYLPHYDGQDQKARMILEKAKNLLDIMAEGTENRLKGMEGIRKMPGFNECRWAVVVFWLEGMPIISRGHVECLLLILISYSTTLGNVIAGGKIDSASRKDVCDFFGRLYVYLSYLRSRTVLLTG